jgi:hypothetical protein
MDTAGASTAVTLSSEDPGLASASDAVARICPVARDVPARLFERGSGALPVWRISRDPGDLGCVAANASPVERPSVPGSTDSLCGAEVVTRATCAVIGASQRSTAAVVENASTDCVRDGYPFDATNRTIRAVRREEDRAAGASRNADPDCGRLASFVRHRA